jgi:hypothetical protein
MKSMEHKTISGINQRLSKAANAAAKSLIGQHRVFSDLRGAWAKILFGNRSDEEYGEKELSDVITDGKTLSNLVQRSRRITLLT